MAWTEKRRRGDGGVSARVIWRLSGTRDGARQVETFSAGTDAQNLARADGFKKMVDAAGQRWPEGWVPGEGFVRPAGEADPLKAPPRFVDIGEEYVRQIVDLSPGSASATWVTSACWSAPGCAGRCCSPSRSPRSPTPI